MALEVMDTHGIAAAMLSMVSSSAQVCDDADGAAVRRLARSANQLAAQTIRDHAGRFGGFARLPMPDVDGALTEIDYALGTLELDGVVLLTNTRGVYLGDSRLDPVFDELNRRGAVVVLHPTSPACFECTSLGYPPAMMEFMFDTTRAVTHLILSGTLERCPKLRMIVPHAGWTLPFLVDRIDAISKRQATSAAARAPAGRKSYLRRLYYDLATSTNPYAVASLLQLVDTSRILFGSDWPALAEAGVTALIETLLENPLLQPGDLAKIQRQNALELFPSLRLGAAVR